MGFADTECTILKFINEFIEGESKDSTPKWPGISGIKNIFSDSRNEIANLDDTTANRLSTQRLEVKSAKEAFEEDLHNQGENIYLGANYKKTLNSLSVENQRGDYKLDLVYLFGEFNKLTDDSEPTCTPGSLVEGWYNEYKETAKKAEEFMEIIDRNYGELKGKKTEATNSLESIEGSIGDIEVTMNEVKDQISGAIFDYGNIIEEYGKLGFKIVFSVLMVFDVAIAAFMTLLLFFSLSCNKCCCCCRCLLKSLIHILWNVLALLAFLTLLLGSLFTLIGTVGKDLVSVVSYLVSDENLNKEEPILLNGEAKKYLKECVNGEGNIKEIIDGVDLNSIDNIDELKKAKSKIDSAKEESARLSNTNLAYNTYLKQYTDRVEYKIDNFELIRIDKNYKFNFGEELNSINNNINNEKWSISCNPTDNCDSTRVDDSFLCINPSSCNLKTTNDWYTSGTNSLIDSSKIIAAFIESIKEAKKTTTEAKSIYNALNSLIKKYRDFLSKETSSLGTYQDSISSLTSIFNRFSGEEGDAFSIINCKFMGKNIKVILKYLENSLGKSFYTVGICMVTSGLSLLVSISFTILLNSIITSNVSK